MTDTTTTDRRERYAAAIRKAGDTAYGNRPFYEAIAAAVIDVADAEQAAVRSQVVDWAAGVVDAKLSVEPDHGRASALYEVLLDLRGELPCTCARSRGLHEKRCRKYVPGHELISPALALAAYRAEAAACPSA